MQSTERAIPSSRRSRFWRRSVLLGLVLCTAGAACAPAITPLGTTRTTPAHDGEEGESATTEATTSETLEPTITASRFRTEVDSMFALPTFRTATWSALVVGPNGDTVYAYRPAALVIPASNMKIVTAAVALTQLGPSYRFRDTAVAIPLRDTLPSDFGPMYDTMLVRDGTLADVLPKMLKPSQNKLAEQVFRTVGLEGTNSLSPDSAAAVVGRQLADWGVPADGYILKDGSGYDRANYLSAETITHVLSIMRANESFPVFYESLPVAGVDGTLVRRMRATRAEQNAHAKTGSLRSIRALSGYVTSADGEQLTFSFICNAYTTPADSVLRVMDRAVARLATLTTHR